MRDTLKERIEAFSKDLDKTHFLERTRAIEQFITTELNVRDVPYTITVSDLSLIRCHAVQETINLVNDTRNFDSLAYTWTMAVTNWLRGRDMLYFVIRGQNGEPSGQKPNTDKSNA